MGEIRTIELHQNYDSRNFRCIRPLRERSLLILGTRAEDNFAQSEKVSYPILNIEIVFVPHHLSAKCLVPHPEVYVQKIDLCKDTKLSQAIFIPLK